MNYKGYYIVILGYNHFWIDFPFGDEDGGILLVKRFHYTL